MLVQHILNVLNNRMGRPPNSQLKDNLEYTMSKFCSIMGRSAGEVPKVNIGDFTIYHLWSHVGISPNIITTENTNK